MYNFLKPYLLFHPPLPKPLHGLNPRSVMGQEWWDEKRFAAQKENNYCCWACGVHKRDAKFHKWLEGHESFVIDYKAGVAELDEIVSLCHSCHNYIHSGLLKINYQNGKIDIERYNYIIEHGNEIIEPLMKMPAPDFANMNPYWNDWHLIIDGEKHYSKFKSESDWAKHYRGK